jgi:hypothetical protein
MHCPFVVQVECRDIRSKPSGYGTLAVRSRSINLEGLAMETVVLWRPVGPRELDLIRRSGMRAFPPRL